eukprot:27155_1
MASSYAQFDKGTEKPEFDGSIAVDIENTSDSPFSDNPFSSVPTLTGEAGGTGDRESDLDRREKEIELRESALRARELHVNALEQRTIQPNNWPHRRWAIDYHDISMDIPGDHQLFCRRAYHMYIAVVIVFWWTVFYRLAQFSDSVGTVLFSILYAFGATYFAWKGWYKSLYGIMKEPTRMGWVKFWFWFALHIITVVCQLVPVPYLAPAGMGVTSFVTDLLAGHWFLVVVSGIGMVLWAYIVIFSLAVLKGAQAMYAGRDIREDIKNESNMRVMQNVIRGVMD